MRKLLLLAGSFLMGSALFAQKLDDIKKDVSGSKYTDAKTKVDQFLSDPKNASNSDALFYKAVVYENLGKQSKDTAMMAAALDAMRRYMQQEESKPEGQRALLSTLENHKTLFDLYSTFRAQGAENFDAKNYSGAFNNFERALDAMDVMIKRNIVNIKFDTTTNLYAGYAAQNAKQYNDAARYYDRLINMNIADTSYVGIYNFMIQRSLENKDTAAAKKYLGISQERFPKYSDDWLDYQTRFLSSDKSKRFDEYQALVQANPKNETLAMNYAIELYNTARASEKADPAMRGRAEAALKNVLAMNPNSTSANLLISQLYWTELYDLQSQADAVKGATPAANAKRKEINAQMDATFDKVYPYLQHTYDQYSAQTNLKPADKANYKVVLGQLASYYTQKKQAAKAAEMQQKAKAIQ